MQRICAHCNTSFEVTNADLAFYEKISPTFNRKKYAIPPPTVCPRCRHQRRLTWRDERVLYKRPCSMTNKVIISTYSPDKPFVVYDNNEWYGSGWDAKEYGRDIDWNRPFFPQFRELMENVPLLARGTFNLQNSDFTNQCGSSKNCYLIFEADDNENCMYSNNMFNSRFSIDCLYVVDCELCFECIDCVQCYNCKYTQECNNCFDCIGCYGCIGCKQCIGCVNLRNKEHYIFNKQCTPDEYKRKVLEVMNGSRSSIGKYVAQFKEFTLTFPHRCYRGAQNESSFGDHIRNTQRCYNCYDLYNAQDCKHVYNSRNTKKVHDMMVFGAEGGVEFCYENHEVGASCRNIVFCDQIYEGCSELYYCKSCVKNTHHCFGSISIKHGEYCILNKKYAPEEYEATAAKLVTHMQKTGEWGQPLPSSISPYCYNESIAQQIFPLTPEEARAKGYAWKDKIIEIQEIKMIIPADRLPDRIQDIPDDVLNWAIRCPTTNRPFRILKQEYEFYKTHNVPIPRHHPDERHRLRLIQRNPQCVWNRRCGKCNKEIWTSFAPERPETVYCEECYREAVE